MEVGHTSGKFEKREKSPGKTGNKPGGGGGKERTRARKKKKKDKTGIFDGHMILPCPALVGGGWRMQRGQASERPAFFFLWGEKICWRDGKCGLCSFHSLPSPPGPSFFGVKKLGKGTE